MFIVGVAFLSACDHKEKPAKRREREMEARVGLAVLSLAAILSLTCGILHGRSAGRDRKDGASQFVKLRPPPPLTARLRERLAGERPFSLPVARGHQIRRCGADLWTEKRPPCLKWTL